MLILRLSSHLFTHPLQWGWWGARCKVWTHSRVIAGQLKQQSTWLVYMTMTSHSLCYIPNASGEPQSLRFQIRLQRQPFDILNFFLENGIWIKQVSSHFFSLDDLSYVCCVWSNIFHVVICCYKNIDKTNVEKLVKTKG